MSYLLNWSQEKTPQKNTLSEAVRNCKARVLFWALCCHLKIKKELKKTTKILFKHYLFGLIAVLFGFWLIGEIPSWYTIERDWIQWLTTILSIPIVGLFISWQIDNRLKKNQKNIYFFSALMIFLTWIIVLYSKALTMGIIGTIQSGQEKVLESIIGYSIYQLWIYAVLGIINGLLGGIFLGNDLKRNIKTAHNIK